ncbi:hypothetical protein T440DRAFT_272366 [Plenodomus tracheiphilus IPT5]|uniref:Uncharacterized protein n=1 Tax=Plenodomus tracheiphilus IPT5 TaxID=1408161 RepID=A0A6A7BFV6_9PLEO|nr:hypothetical protein T440DRAFT_272366 [Plenodomus tracheiphilus IPT5]
MGSSFVTKNRSPWVSRGYGLHTGLGWATNVWFLLLIGRLAGRRYDMLRTTSSISGRAAVSDRSLPAGLTGVGCEGLSTRTGEFRVRTRDRSNVR